MANIEKHALATPNNHQSAQNFTGKIHLTRSTPNFRSVSSKIAMTTPPKGTKCPPTLLLRSHYCTSSG